MKAKLAVKASLKKSAEPRKPRVLLVEAKGLDEPGLKLFAKKLGDEEIKNLIEFANERKETKNEANKEYEAARVIIQAYARLQQTQTLSGSGGVQAKFEPRSQKEIDVWGVYMDLRKREVYKQGNAEVRKSLFNAIFSLNRGVAASILGEETIEAHTETKTDDHAVLKLK